MVVSLCLLFDNGSLRPASTINLRRIAKALEKTLGREVRPVSLLHSSAVPASELDGVPAEILEPALERLLGEGENSFILLPLFFGPSAALTDYLPRRLARLRRKHPQLRARVAPWLVRAEDASDQRVAAIVADRIRETRARHGLGKVPCILVDHGSPQPGVAEVRNLIGRQLSGLLAGEVGPMAVASMERRPGPEYAFNEPLLADQLDQKEYREGPVIVAPLFFSPGRHAGPEGDIAALCREAEARHPGLNVHLTGLVGEDPRLIDILADRYREAR